MNGGAEQPAWARPPQAAGTLVIGWGNDLRGDDGAGRAVARAVAAWQRDDICVLETHQLTPELAWPVAKAEQVIFVDAEIVSDASSVRLAPLTADNAPPAAWQTAHVGSPQAVLDLARTLYGATPQAWCIAVPVEQCALGEALSPGTAQAVAEAVQLIKEWLAKQEERNHASMC